MSLFVSNWAGIEGKTRITDEDLAGARRLVSAIMAEKDDLGVT